MAIGKIIKKALNYLIETEKNHYDESPQSEPELMEQTGHRMRVGNRMEWFGVHYLDKICRDVDSEDYLSSKYETLNKGE